jgi:DNA-binding transcriptional ArsR family regulator
VIVEQPVLWLGTAGFPAAQQQRLSAVLADQPAGWPIWRMSRFADADAWCIDGAHMRVLRDGTVKIAGSPGSDRGVQLNLDEVDRPVAFAKPLLQPDFEPMYTFDLGSDSSVRGVLQQFEGWLRPLRAQFALGAEMIERESSLKAGVYHVSHKSTLLAVIDLNEWRAGISPTARPVDFDDSAWEKRPDAASAPPERFVRCSLTQLMWTYAQRTRRDVLPARYRAGMIYFRRSPRVALRLLQDSHLLLLRELASAPGSFDSLQQRTGLSPARLSRHLASLYFAGSITSSIGRSARDGVAVREEAELGAQPVRGEMPNSPIGPDSRFNERYPSRDGPAGPSDRTAPAPLQFE